MEVKLVLSLWVTFIVALFVALVMEDFERGRSAKLTLSGILFAGLLAGIHTVWH